MKLRKRRTAGYIALLLLSVLILFLLSPGLRSEAGELVEETYQKTSHLYDRYRLSNYSLDFYVDTSLADALPWNWSEGFGKSISYALFLFTDVIWNITALIAYFAGYLVEQAYNLDFISDTISYLAANIQKLAGVGKGGFLGHGLIPSFLPIAIIVMGAYFFYLAVVKSQLTKAVSSLVTFLVIAVLGMGVIAYSGSYLNQINTFQKDFNKEVLSISNTLTLGGSEDGVSGVRDSLFSVTVYEPYLLLQYGTTDTGQIGEERIAGLLSEQPGSMEREELVKTEVGENQNEQMGLGKVGSRFGSVLLIFILNLVLCICVGIFAGFMIFSQIMFVLYVSFLPVGLVMALFPNNIRSLTGLLEKVFETLMKKAWITVILSVVFGLSSMCYRLSGSKNFLWTMFLQLVLFVGALTKSGELLGFMTLHGDSGDKAVKRAGSRIGSAVRTLMLGKLMLGSDRGSGGNGLAVSGSPGGSGGSGGSENRRTPGAGTGDRRTSKDNADGGSSTSGTGAGANNSNAKNSDKPGAGKDRRNDDGFGAGTGGRNDGTAQTSDSRNGRNGSEPKIPGAGTGNRRVPGAGAEKRNDNMAEPRNHEKGIEVRSNGRGSVDSNNDDAARTGIDTRDNGTVKTPGAGRNLSAPEHASADGPGRVSGGTSDSGSNDMSGGRNSRQGSVSGTQGTQSRRSASQVEPPRESVRQTEFGAKPWVVRRRGMREDRETGTDVRRTDSVDKDTRKS